MMKNKMETSPLMFPEFEGRSREDNERPEQELNSAVSRKGRSRKTSLVINDCVIVILEFFQILALIQLMSLKWSYPYSWIYATNFMFFVNLDFWEMTKVSSGAFKGIQGYDTPSTDMPFSYNFVLLAMGLLLFIMFMIAFIIYAVLWYRKRPYLFVHVARMFRALVIAVQVLTIPIGIVIFRLVNCTSDGKLDVMNEVDCFTAYHCIYIVPAFFVAVGLFVVFPAWMVYRIRREVLSATTDHHESYLQLKEMEYMSGLDVVWIVKGYHLFSSFNLRAIYYRPLMQMFKLVLLIVYSASFQHIFPQAVALSSVLFVFWLLLMVLRPFRLTSFNVLQWFGFLCLTADATIGASIAAYKPSAVESPWLVQPYIGWVLGSINGILVFSCFVFLVHLLIYQFCCYKKFGYDPLWPSMASRNNCQISKETKKFMYAVIKGRAILEKCKTMPALFCPVYELSQQIQLINAYLREAEKLDDGFHDTLWDLLDEMLDAHRQIEPNSLLSESVRESIRYNAEEFLKLMPMFSRRLAQRDYDFILVSPVKKRLLLKMNIIGMFMHGKRDAKAKKNITYPELQKIWPQSSMKKTNDIDGEYCQDLYPEKLLGPDSEEMFESSTLQLPLELVELDETDETDSLTVLLRPNSSQSWLQSQSNSVVSLRSGIHNPAFIKDEKVNTTEKLILTDYEIGESSVDDSQQVGNPSEVIEDESRTQLEEQKTIRQSENLISLSDEQEVTGSLSVIDETENTRNSSVYVEGAEVGETTTDAITEGSSEERKRES